MMKPKRVSVRSKFFILLENTRDSLMQYLQSTPQYKGLLEHQELQNLNTVITDFVSWENKRKGKRTPKTKYAIPPGLNKEGYMAVFGEDYDRLQQLKDEFKRQRSMLEMMEKGTSPTDIKKLRKERLEPLERAIKELESKKGSQ